MPLTCADWLPVLQPHLKEPLFSPQGVERLRALASRLPGNCQGVLEARLAPGSAPVDLSLRLLDGPQAHEMARRLPPSHYQEFLDRWARGEEPLVPVRAVWLELDLDREPVGIPAPVLCAKLPPAFDRRWLTGSLIPALHGMPLSARQLELVHRCLDAIPAPASLLYVFSLRSRGGEAVRLEVFGMEPDQIPGYLRRMALEETARAAQEATPLFVGVERIHLSFDVAEEVLPRIGIEGSFPRLPVREPRWAELFGRLVERGLCTAEKTEAALAWPGYDSFWTAPAAWPLASGVRRACARALSHVKVVCRPGPELEAKVYLAFEPLERSGAGAVASSPARRSVSST